MVSHTIYIENFKISNALNNPTKYTDPTGEFWEIVAGFLFSTYVHGAQATGELNPFKWNAGQFANAAMGAGSIIVSNYASDKVDTYVQNYGSNQDVVSNNAITANNNIEDHVYVSSSSWSPLTNTIFNNYVKEKYNIKDNQLGNEAGNLFEKAFIDFGLLNFDKTANFKGSGGRSSISKPDAYSDGLHFNLWRWQTYRYKSSVWWEVKAREKNVTLDGQIKGFINSIHNEFKYTATKTGAAFLCLVTTSNSGMNPSVYAYGTSMGVQIHHWQAQYKMVDGSMLINFGYATGPLNPYVYEFTNYVKL